MKKLLSSLLVCFVLITCCNATSTVGDVYFNEYPIKISGSNYKPNMPILNYQGRTYLPLSEFSTVLGKNINFSNNEISITDSTPSVFNAYTSLNNIADYVYDSTEHLILASISNESLLKNYLVDTTKEDIEIIKNNFILGELLKIRLYFLSDLIPMAETDELISNLEKYISVVDVCINSISNGNDFDLDSYRKYSDAVLSSLKTTSVKLSNYFDK